MPNTTMTTEKIILIPYSALTDEASESMDQKLKQHGWTPAIYHSPEDVIIYMNEIDSAIQYDSAQFSFFIRFI